MQQNTASNWIVKRRFASAKLLPFAACLAFAGSVCAQAVEEMRPQSVRLESTAKGDVVKGSVLELEGNLAIIFETGPLSYRVLPPEMTQSLCLQPIVDTPQGLKAELNTLRASKTKIETALGTGDGYAIHCKLRISTEDEIEPGDYSILDALPAITEIANVMKATSPNKPVKCTFHVTVYESQQALDAERLAQTKALETAVRKAREEREAAQRLAEQKAAESEAAEKARMSTRVFIIGSSILGAVVAIGVVVMVFGPWLLPKHRITVRGNNSATTKGSVRRKASIAEAKINSDPEPLTDTSWARSLWGVKADVRVEVVAISADRTINRITSTTTNEAGTVVGTSVSYEAITKYQLLITATAGRGAGPCRCLARTVAGSVLIKVV